LSSGDERDNAPARIRAALRLRARVLRSRIDFVKGSLSELYVSFRYLAECAGCKTETV
jgi:hypothetical protein